MEFIKIYSTEFFKLGERDQKKLRIFLACIAIIKLLQSNLWTVGNLSSPEAVTHFIQPLTCLFILYFTIFIKKAPAMFFTFITISFWAILFLDSTLFLTNLTKQSLSNLDQVLRILSLGTID